LRGVVGLARGDSGAPKMEIPLSSRCFEMWVSPRFFGGELFQVED
jgi:hypothetical protein